MKATVLVDNITKSTLGAQWGLSIYIEHRGHRILLDTGANGLFAENASQLHIDLSQVDCGVLSHAHYDHSDGLDTFFRVNPTAPFFLRQGSGENCYDKTPGAPEKYIGIKQGLLSQYKDRISFVRGDYEISPDIFLIPHKTNGLKQAGRAAHMYTKFGPFYRVDNFSHEQSLVLRTKEGLVIFSSCSHGGADRIITEIASTFPGEKIYSLIGGLHLFRSTPEEISALSRRIRETGIEKIYTGHCTGAAALSILQEELGTKVESLYTGCVITCR